MSAYNDKQARVAVTAIILRDGKVLFGKRKGGIGSGTWGFPGGSLEFGESPDECVRREVLEETGMKVKSCKLGTITNDVFLDEGKQWINIFMVVDAEGTPQIIEPQKCEEWQWFQWEHAPEPLFMPEQTLKKQKYDPFAHKKSF